MIERRTLFSFLSYHRRGRFVQPCGVVFCRRICYDIVQSRANEPAGAPAAGRNNMKAVITVVGRDMVGILARVANECAKVNANVIEVNQSVLQDMFAMIMLIDITKLSCELTVFSENMNALGDELGLKILVMHEDIFNSMHRV